MINWRQIFKRLDRWEAQQGKHDHDEYLYELQQIVEEELKVKLEPGIKALGLYASGFVGEDGDEAREALIVMGYRKRDDV